jgi:hypothetical protein
MEKADKEWSKEEVEELEVPLVVKAVPRFANDIKALQRLMKSDVPALKRA